MKKHKEKIIFVLGFIFSYFLLLVLTYPLSKIIIEGKRKLIVFLFGNSLNYTNFVFVPYCSGVVSLSVLLAALFGFWLIKREIKRRRAVFASVLILAINLVRIILILIIEKISNLFVAEIFHTLSWFVMIFVIFVMVKKIVK